MSNTRRTKMSAAEVRQLEADWHRARMLERLALMSGDRDRQPAAPQDDTDPGPDCD